MTTQPDDAENREDENKVEQPVPEIFDQPVESADPFSTVMSAETVAIPDPKKKSSL
jgi:hypothetical protein